MPDHGHFLWLGVSDGSHQQLGMRMLRRGWNELLKGEGNILQRQAYDHVLKESERERGAFQSVAQYIFENPVRKELVTAWKDWEFSGCAVPGYPRLDICGEHFWENFWKAYNQQISLQTGCRNSCR